MIPKVKKYRRHTAFFVGIIMLLSTLTLTAGAITVDKNPGNECMSKENETNRAAGKQKRQYMEELIAKGYSEKEIMEAQMLVERVLFQLQEIISGKKEPPKMPNNHDGIITEDEQEISEYEELINKIEPETAIILLLELKEEFGSIKKVLDEYLLAVQLGIDLTKYLADKESYQEEKLEKSLGRDLTEIITVENIETKILQKIETVNQISEKESSILPETGVLEDTPRVTLPEEINIRPENPLDDVMKEIEQIKNKSLNIPEIGERR